ncbi:hypothetical protein VP14_194 [Vibrio phage VPMCC14]|nr:hypothetical protein VP14_194 [Vibrio phage VPMCC14]
MKKKFRKQFHKEFPWHDQEYLLDVMILWTENASKMHSKYGNLVRSDDTSHKLKVITELLKRIRNNCYDKPCEVFQCRNKIIKRNETTIPFNKDIIYLDSKYTDKLRKQDKDLAFGMLAKYLDEFWD